MAAPVPRPTRGVDAPTSGGPGWNTLRLDGGIDDEELIEAVDASYDAVVAKLPKRERPTA